MEGDCTKQFEDHYSTSFLNGIFCCLDTEIANTLKPWTKCQLLPMLHKP